MLLTTGQGQATVATTAHTDPGPPQASGLELAPLDAAVTLSHFHVTIFLDELLRGSQVGVGWLRALLVAD